MSTTQHPSAGEHRPVMVAECIDGLGLAPGRVVIDGTLGQGGHARAFRDAVLPGGQLIGLDLDPDAIMAVKTWLGDDQDGVTLVHESFENLSAVVKRHAPGGVDAIFLDLGVSRDQLISGRFSFQGDGPLDFRLDPTRGETAADLLARLSETELADLLFEYGDERFARRIARGIVETRRDNPLRTAEQLVEVIRRAYPAGARHGRIHIATRTFQALRIAANGMMTALETALQDAPRLLKPGGRLAILTYHSGEDGRVKRAFRDLFRAEHPDSAGFELVTRKPIGPSEAECLENPGARSARLRVLAAREPGTASAGEERRSR
ncbi:MAG: 16S rRNA (cytosine(1402)-N(4))-methyltransferase RsmH [Armatimonadetes bacterium]|nr:16S rRNA (cytosine(1402)-N(4))-methyltransferase RsmH [Armatimonadota bacterium]